MNSSSQDHQKILCEYCHSLNVRHSKWVSQLEKNTHPDGSPYRCLDCSKRFIGAKSSGYPTQNFSLTSTRVFLMAGALLTALVILFLIIVNTTETTLRQNASAAASSAEKKADQMRTAEKGDAQAQFEVGQSLLQASNGNPETTALALGWLKKSAASGNANAMVALGRLSKSGVGVLQNYALSLEWIKAAADKGNPDGMLELGRLYRDGVAVDRDMAQAYIWLNRAAAMQNRTAAQERDVIARTFTAEELKEAQSRSSVNAPIPLQ